MPDVLGKGSFKTVYRAQDVATGRMVAWNEISVRSISQKEKDRVVNEMKLLKTLSHRSLLSFYAAWVDKVELKVIFITELMSSGTLRE